MNKLNDVIIISKCGYDKAGLRNLDPSEGYMYCDVIVLG